MLVYTSEVEVTIVKGSTITEINGLQLSPDDAVQQWLQQTGFVFNPFRALDASEDPHLGQYLIQLEAFDQIWGAWSSLVFEPPGGGKTAMRLYTASSCYIGHETNRPFPITYCPPFLAWDCPDPGLDEHMHRILQSSAAQLLLSLVYRPRWFLRLDAVDQRAVVEFLSVNLDRPLREPLRLGHQPNAFRLLRNSLNVFLNDTEDIPDDDSVSALCGAFESLIDHAPPHIAVADRWESLCTTLLDILEFDRIFLLLDGFDASPDTVDDPHSAIRTLEPLIQALPKWQRRKVFIKGFLPDVIQEPLYLKFSGILANVESVRIEWSQQLLVDMVRQRVTVGTQGEFQSLDAIADPDFDDVESRLVAKVPLLPREVIVLTNRMLWEHVVRDGQAGRLQVNDLVQAVTWFQQQRRT